MEIIDIIFYGLKILIALLIMVLITSYIISKVRREKNNNSTTYNPIKNIASSPDYNKIYLPLYYRKIDQSYPPEIKYEKSFYPDFNFSKREKPLIIKKSNIFENNTSMKFKTKTRYTVINEALKSRNKSIINFY